MHSQALGGPLLPMVYDGDDKLRNREWVAMLLFHVLLSLVGIVSGIVVLFGMVNGRRLSGFTALFLATTVLTSVTGFVLPAMGFDPARRVGAISLIALAAAIAALYGFGLRGAWRWIYVGTATFALYLNCFVAVVQAFQKIPALHALAPKGSEPPFVIAQILVLGLFVILGIVSLRRFHPMQPAIHA